VTKNSDSISAIKTAPETPATTRIPQSLRADSYLKMVWRFGRAYTKTRLELERLVLVLRQLRQQLLAVVSNKLGANLETEVDGTPERRVAAVQPLDRSTIWPYREGEPGDFYYQRYAHPTGVEAERQLGALEGGEALLFPSGSAAITTLVLAELEPGQTIALAAGAYYGTGLLFRALGRWGVGFVEFDQTGAPPDGVELVWLEAPSNPFLTMPDFEAAAAHGARVVVDSTAATPVYLRPLEQGADYVVHSATKYLGGHHDLLLGAVVCRAGNTAERLREFRGRTGIVATPDSAWLLSRSLKTLRARVERQTATATELAARLEAHRAVERVRYPGFGGLISFDVHGDARSVETAVRLITNATSLGGVESLLESRYRWEGNRVPENLLRLSVGLEELDELWSDLDQALARA
jgi:cystathionine gamma-synthase